MPQDSIVSELGTPARYADPGPAKPVVTSRPSPTLVGRARQLATLADAVRTAQAGRPATVLIGGEAGAGKSRLVREFARHAQGRVLIGSCVQLGSWGVPFAPFTTVLRQLVREPGWPGAADLLPTAEHGELGRLLPELGEPAGRADDAYHSAARALLFEQTLALLRRLALGTPLTLVIEDAQLADRSTRDLLAFLVGNQHVLRGVVIVMTFRSDELCRTHPLRPLLAELSRVGWTERIDLPRLTRDEIADQIAAIIGAEPSPTYADSVFRRSGGNPLFVEHLIGRAAARPDSLRDLVLARLHELPADTTELLQVASLAGNRLGHGLLAEVSGLGEANLSRALRPALAGDVLAEDCGGYEFRHALMQEAIAQDLLPGERSLLHARYAEAIAANPSLVPAGRAAMSAAHHWHAARDVTQALISAWQAAAEAGRSLAYPEQLSMLALVLELWDRVPDAANRIGADHVAVLNETGRVCRLGGDAARATALVAAAARAVSESGPRLGRWPSPGLPR